MSRGRVQVGFVYLVVEWVEGSERLGLGTRAGSWVGGGMRGLDWESRRRVSRGSGEVRLRCLVEVEVGVGCINSIWLRLLVLKQLSYIVGVVKIYACKSLRPGVGGRGCCGLYWAVTSLRALGLGVVTC